MGQRRGGGRGSGRPSPCQACRGARSHDPESTAWAETRSQTPIDGATQASRWDTVSCRKTLVVELAFKPKSLRLLASQLCVVVSRFNGVSCKHPSVPDVPALLTSGELSRHSRDLSHRGVPHTPAVNGRWMIVKAAFSAELEGGLCIPFSAVCRLFWNYTKGLSFLFLLKNNYLFQNLRSMLRCISFFS